MIKTVASPVASLVRFKWMSTRTDRTNLKSALSYRRRCESREEALTLSSTTVIYADSKQSRTHGSSAEEEGRQYTEGYDYDFETDYDIHAGRRGADVLYYYSGASLIWAHN